MKIILKKSKVSEKTSGQVALSKYVFIVAAEANKFEIKQAVESNYGVKVKDVNTLWLPGKVRRRGRITGRTADYKKAVVTLQKGQTLEAVKNEG